MTVRLLQPKGLDFERMASLHAEAFELPWRADDFAGLFGAPGMIAVAAGDLDGFILLRAVADEAEILTLAVRPSARRRGLGLALVRAAEAAAAERGADALWLEVAADNAAALALYDKAAFDEAGRRRGYYRRVNGTRMDAVLMRRALNTAPGSAYSP
jgi:ribosomal-protein-alanine N-acetyltransferase